MESINDPTGRRGPSIVVTLEVLLYPLYFLQAALHIARDARTTLFELSLVRSWRILFASRIAAFTISLTPVYLPSVAILYFNGLGDLIIPLTLKTAGYISIASIAVLLYSRRGALAFLLTASIILPMSALIIVNSTPPGYKLGPLESSVLYYISPITLHEASDILAVEEATAQLSALLISLAIILVSGIIFAKQEVEF